MSRYPTVKLSAASEIVPGYAFKSGEFGTIGTTVIKIKDVNPPVINIRDADKVDTSKYPPDRLKKYQLGKGDFVVAMTGATIGKIGKHVSDEKLYINQRVAKIVPSPKFCKEFIYYAIQGDEFLKFILNRLDSSSAQGNISGGSIGQYPIPHPSFDGQCKIAAVLSTLDAKIELNNQINAELEAMAKLMYDYWFVQFDFPMTAAQAASLGRPALEGKPYKSSGGKMVHNPTLNRQIPEGWSVNNLGELCSTTRGVTYGKTDVRTPSDSGTIPILRATNVTNGILDINDLVYVSEGLASSDQLMSQFDILMVMSSGSKAHVGKNALYYFDFKTAYGAFCSKITAHVKNRFFVAVHLQSEGFKKHISNVCLGTSINNLTNAHITDYQLIVPREQELSRYESAVGNFFQQIASNQNQNRELTQLRDWLLPMLMNGQVTVGA